MPRFLESVKPVVRDFWRGLTTPDVVAVKMAAVLLLVALGGLSVAAERFRRQIESGSVDWRSVPDDFCRASVLAMRGAPRECDPVARTIIFVGPSAMRDWLPPDKDTDAVASAAAGGPVRVLAMCGARQGCAAAAALIDHFGSDFNGWFVIGVTRQMIACRRNASDTMRRRRESQELGFHSDLHRHISAALGHPQEIETGWELWDHRRFHYHSLLKPGLGLPRRMPRLQLGKPPDTATPRRDEYENVGPMDLELLDRHLTVLRELAKHVRGRGRARLALVETPWEEHLVLDRQSPEQAQDEAAYRRRMKAWSDHEDVPWITAPTTFPATSSDFRDSRHVGSLSLRHRFLEVVVQELSTR